MCLSILILQLMMHPCCIRSCCSACVCFSPSTNHFIQLNCSFLTVSIIQHYCAWDWLSAAAKRFQPAVPHLYWSDRCWSDPSPHSCSPFAQEILSLFTEGTLCPSRHCSSSSNLSGVFSHFLPKQVHPSALQQVFFCWMLNPVCLPLSLNCCRTYV